MANFLDKVKVPVAVNHNTPLDLSCDHITTANFMQYNVAYKKEVIPGEHVEINCETFTRMDPLVVPTFGRCNIYNRAFFVPFRTIMKSWNSFITDSPFVSQTGSGLVSIVHTIANDELLSFLESTTCSSAVTMLQSSDIDPTQAGNVLDSLDFYVIDESNSTSAYTRYTGYVLNSFGRQAYKMLTSLGYTINPDPNDESVQSALPLLAVAKVYCDWYYPQAYAMTDRMASIEQLFASESPLTLTASDLANIFDMIQWVCYDSDYFTSQFDRPDGPNAGLSSTITINDVNGVGVSPSTGNVNYNTVSNTTLATANPFGVPVAAMRLTAQGTTNNYARLSQYGIDCLKALTDYFKRHQLVGGRAMDRYLSRFGIQLSSEKLNRSDYLGTDKVPVQIGDVMSNSDTTGASLGDYAGKGIAFGSNTFKLTTDEYGMVIIISSIVPQIDYYQGTDRNNLHLTKLDYYTPEFDNLSVQATGRKEVFNPLFLDGRPAPYNVQALSDGVYGYIPRYAEYKVGRSVLSGDYRVNSRNTGMDSWYLMREFTPRQISDISAVTHNINTLIAKDAAQYSRIFQNTNGTDDHFKMIYHFNVKSQSPMSSLFDNYHFETEGESKEVTENIGGVKMN